MKSSSIALYLCLLYPSTDFNITYYNYYFLLDAIKSSLAEFKCILHDFSTTELNLFLINNLRKNKTFHRIKWYETIEVVAFFA